MKNEKKLVLSVSRVDTYKKCPRKYYYRYIKRLPTKDWPHFNLGTFVHGSLENFHNGLLKNASQRRSDLMKKSCDSFYKEMCDNGKVLQSEQAQEAKEMLANYLAKLVNDPNYEVISLEEKFQFSLNNKLDFMGFVDRLDKDSDGLYHIKDYKTNKSLNYMKPFQLNAYGLWLIKKYPEVERYRGSYIMMRFNGKLMPYDFTKEDVEKVKKSLIESGERILEEERWITKPSKLCDWCDFKETCFNSWNK